MSIGNSGFHPSLVEDRIYDLMDKEENIAGVELFTENLFTDVSDMLHEHFPEIEWESFSTTWQNEEGYHVSFAWVEDGHIHLIGWDAVKAVEPANPTEIWEICGYDRESSFWRSMYDKGVMNR